MIERLEDRGERALLETIRRLIPPTRGVRLGPGDDAAVLAPLASALLITTDAMVEDVHFRAGWLPPRALGARAFEVSASDVAAMGGRVVAAVLAIAAPPSLPVAAVRAIVAGVRDRARAAGGALVGGNLASAAALSLTVTVLGAAPARPITRAGARPGDHLFVTGTLGGAALGLRWLRGDPSIPGVASAVRYWQRPRARVQTGAVLARRRLATAMIDVSDGLLVDVARLCAASGVGARIDADRLPLPPPLRRMSAEDARIIALSGGEDYELVFAAPPSRLAALAAARTVLDCPVTRIGELMAGRGVAVIDAGGRAIDVATAGHDHFAPPPHRRRGGRRGPRRQERG